jgi:hypothetical protein
MEDQNNITKKQHFVPQFYLKNFAGPGGFLEILDLKNNKLLPRREYGGVGYKQFFYAAETGVQDEVSQQIEKWLRHYENTIARELPAIIEKILGHQHIDDNSRYILAALMCMLWLRSPGMREHLNKMETDMTKQLMRFYAPQRVAKFSEESGKNLTEEQQKDLVRTLEEGAYDVRFNNAQHLRFMTQELGFGGPGFTNMFYGQKWKIYIAKGEKRFMTSDTPVVEWFLPPKTFYGASFLERNKYFALTPEILIELTYPLGSEKVKRTTVFKEEDEMVTIFNMLIGAHCTELAYSGEKPILEDLIEGRNNPGRLEREYYARFEHPWVEYRRKQGKPN